MAIIVGALLALAVGLFATVVGFDRDRAFYPTITIVVGALYALFAVMGATTHTLLLESLVGALFLVAAAVGFKFSLWVVVWALAAHGLFDLVHGQILSNPGVPMWWPQFCSSYDIVAAGYLAMILKGGRIRATP